MKLIFALSKKQDNTGFTQWQAKTFLLCWIAYFLTYFGRLNLSVALEPMGKYFGSSQTFLGLLGSLFFWVYAIGKLVNGYLGDKLNNKRQIFFGLLVSGFCNIMVGSAKNIEMVMVMWGINGFVQSSLWSNIINLMSNWFNPEQYSRMAMWLSTSMVGGAIAGWSGSSLILRYLNWQWSFYLPGASLMGFAVLWLLSTKNTAAEAGFEGVGFRKESTKYKIEKSPSTIKFVVNSGLFLALVSCFAQSVVKEGIGLWGPTIVQGIGGNTGFLHFIPVMNFVGISIAGVLQERLKMSDWRSSQILMTVGAASLVGLWIATITEISMLSTFCLGVASASMYGVNTIMLGVYPLRFVAFNKVGFVSGILDFSSYMVAGASSVAIGYLLDKGGSWSLVFLIWLAITLLGIFTMVIASKKNIVGNNI